MCDADQVRELASRPASRASDSTVDRNRQLSMGDRRVLADIVCAGQAACGRRRPAVSGTCIAARRSGRPATQSERPQATCKADDAGFGCSVGARAPWTGGHQTDVSARGLWTELHRLDWRRPAGPASTAHRHLLIRGFGVRVPGGVPVKAQVKAHAGFVWAFFFFACTADLYGQLPGQPVGGGELPWWWA
jgi:hypothetical protein